MVVSQQANQKRLDLFQFAVLVISSRRPASLQLVTIP